jgi:hypothetical protein
MKILVAIVGLFFTNYVQSQQVGPKIVKQDHPRLITENGLRQKVLLQMQTDAETNAAISKQRDGIDVYVNKHIVDSTWMVSRLQMYWNTKATDVFIKAGVYDHAEGTAPVPTVKFPGTRDNVTAYAAPKLEDIQPYMDDPRGVYLVNRNKPGQPLEWADIAKTGRIIESINTSIMQRAYSAALMFYLFEDVKYAKFAADLFDTYMTGMQYRKEPYDITHGHHQTLVGLSTFEVIQEVNMLNALTGIYDFLYGYLSKNKANKMAIYSDVFRKWADVQISNGVAFNNWNLMQAKNVLNIALMLDDNTRYADGKGNQYYTNYILNTDSERQWSLKKVMAMGYDSTTGMWNESSGYSKGVLEDFVWYVTYFDKYYHFDLVEQLPLLKKCVFAIAQYLFPNGHAASFGDAHYGRTNSHAAYEMVANARKYNKPEQEVLFTKYIKTLETFNRQTGDKGANTATTKNLQTLLFQNEELKLSENITIGKIDEYATQQFFSPNVSYLALRNGMDKETGLMVAMSGSKGNHMHAGGISMEIYGKGLVLGPESGIGTSYFQPDYAEYYSQFPAHNTVLVDGISAYPVMKSNHGFDVKTSYPKSQQTEGFFSTVSFAVMTFVEPETMSDQNRLVSIIRTSDSTGYYVDLFRSKRKDGKDKMHDYIYHNMGQKLSLRNNNGEGFNLQATQKLSFGGGHLFGYDYFYDKKSVSTTNDVNAVFNLDIPGNESVQMNLWIKGEKDREIFALKAPKSTAIDRIGLPKEIADMPLPTIVARQSGEAWTKPFAVVFEPSSQSQPKSLLKIQALKVNNASTEFVGIEAQSANGVTQYILSQPTETNNLVFADKKFKGTYAVISEKNAQLQYLFLGSGTHISKAGFGITSKKVNSAALEMKSNEWYFTSTESTSVSIPATMFKTKKSLLLAGKIYIGKSAVINNVNVVLFELPATAYSKIIF